MRKRGPVLALTFLSVLIVVVACGRASEEDINNALGIVPTATLSGEQIAQATEAAQTAASASGQVARPSHHLPGLFAEQFVLAKTPFIKHRTCILRQVIGC